MRIYHHLKTLVGYVTQNVDGDVKLIIELESLVEMWSYIYSQDPWVMESVFTLVLSGFVASMYVVMNINKRKNKMSSIDN